MIKKKESFSYLTYWGINNLYEWAMPEKLPLGSFEQVEITSQFSKKFIENYNKDSFEGYILEVDV